MAIGTSSRASKLFKIVQKQELFKLYVLSCLSFGCYGSQGSGLFLLSCWIYSIKLVIMFPYFPLNGSRMFCDTTISFLVSVICVFSLWIFLSLARGLSLLFIFSKNQIFVSSFLCIVSVFNFIDFHFCLYHFLPACLWFILFLLFFFLYVET